MTPTTTKALIDAGYKVNVERSPCRVFDDSEFEAVGATLVPEGSWVEAPKERIIVGLKELPEDKCSPFTQPFSSTIQHPLTIFQLPSNTLTSNSPTVTRTRADGKTSWPDFPRAAARYSTLNF